MFRKFYKKFILLDINVIRIYMQVHAFIAANMYMAFLKTKQVYQGSLKSVCVPFLNCQSCPSAFFSCPIGIFQHFMTIHKIPYTLLGFLCAIGMLIGSMACGWLCPFGLFQDFLYKFRSFKIKIPKQLSMLRYFFLLFLVILIPIVTHETWFSKLCPMGTLQAAIPWAAWNPIVPAYQESAVSPQSLGTLFVIKLLILMFFIVLFIISKRPFCRTVCPLGAIFGLFNKISIMKLKVNTKDCKSCHNCSDSCVVDLNVGDDPNDSTCVRCLKCLKCENVNIDFGGFKDKVKVIPDLGLFKKKSGNEKNAK